MKECGRMSRGEIDKSWHLSITKRINRLAITNSE